MISRGLAPIYQAALSTTAGSLYQIEFKQNDVLDNGGSNPVDFAFPTLTSNPRRGGGGGLEGAGSRADRAAGGEAYVCPGKEVLQEYGGTTG